MSIPKSTFSKYIKEVKLKELFNELGWDNVSVKYPVKSDDRLFLLTGIVQKKDFLILLCEPQDGGTIPDSAARKKIDNAITKLHYEHLIIYIDEKKTRQHWELLVREQNKPIVCRPIDYYTGQEPELLFQKLEGLFFVYEDEEKLSIVDVRSRVMENFEKNAEVVTKKFYERFQKEHQKFLNFVEGIQSKVDCEWYASLMLNRLMFIYFIQKKGFLDNDRDYLRNRLDRIKETRGRNQFYNFYRKFLLVLFHKGLGSPKHSPEVEAEIGRVPYLNGGLFDEHKLEQDNKELRIHDEAFERIFDFFDEYNWHLDTRITATGKDINPDVIGYIFEKYINDRAAMGAYYTKEDITEYISKNCIVPWLFDEVKRNYTKPFVGRDAVSTNGDDLASHPTNIWSFLKQSGDKYIYPAVKYGIPQNGLPDDQAGDLFADLPEDVKKGFNPELEKKIVDGSGPHLFEIRKSWNKPAPSDIALPTEIYRELIARRKHYYEVRKKIQQGEITEINDFITYNLDIRQFAQDVLRETDDPKLIMEFYKAVKKITVLDPTCGSGAFLFAALNVLEPIYFACVTRMREFVEEHGKGKHKFFEDELKLIDSDDHPNEEYFIYKSIILHNLFGVDIMKEAVEIAKLRLFLELVATCDVDYTKLNLGLEPLPDIDFNIRSGNTLVGYATLADLDKSAQGGLFGSKEKDAILEQADVVSRAYARFKDSQLVMHTDPKSYKDAKDELVKRLGVLNERLNNHLAVTYLGENHSKKAYEAWLGSHQPFHWLAEYYTTIAQCGFDVIIGNPPYVEYSSIRNVYTVKNFETESSGNLYTYVIEKSIGIQHHGGYNGMIIPLSAYCTDRMEIFQQFQNSHSCCLWLSNYAERPSKLFEGAERNLTIYLLKRDIFRDSNENKAIFSTQYHKWISSCRNLLFHQIKYERAETVKTFGIIPKIGYSCETSIMMKLRNDKTFVKNHCSGSISSHVLYYRNSGGRYWKIITDFQPSFLLNGKKSISSRESYLYLKSKLDLAIIVASLNSSMYYWFYVMNSDARTNNPSDLKDFPVDRMRMTTKTTSMLQELNEHLMKDLDKNSIMQDATYRTGDVTFKQFFPQNSKPIIDEIDKVLAKHYGFTEEELDFIINYDIKYRMGKELEEEE